MTIEENIIARKALNEFASMLVKNFDAGAPLTRDTIANVFEYVQTKYPLEGELAA